MASVDIPLFGTWLLYAILLAASYTFFLALRAVKGSQQRLAAARMATYATCALVATAVCLLAYAFQTHDFRIRYVAHYSDRSMPLWYLIASLWGGQDGSLLWWAFLLSLYTLACVRSLRGKHWVLQPYVIATLMSILMFFGVLMLFAANPFATSLAQAPVDGEGLNPLLQNPWMVIHPPSLYMGFVGWSVPFAFVIAALVSGQLDDEWIFASRRWALIAWLFLSLGNLLGALWSYEELGWGGYWAWDPVENAAFLPWLSATAYLHSIMIQERRGMLKVWNVFLLCLTFILTIFGTFLTRSGLIASVHSFARSDIGVYFVGYLIVLVVAVFALIAWRLPLLRAEARLDSLLSREFAFMMNNWILMGMQFFVLVATTFPLLSEWLRGQTVTVGPSYYNKWMAPLGLILLFLAGLGPLMAWRRATKKNLLHALKVPACVGLIVGALHASFGTRLSYPPFVKSEALYDTWTGQVLATIYGWMPLCSTALCAFVLAATAQEFAQGLRARRKNTTEAWGMALVRMVAKAKRRYGGYIVHVGIVCMFIGFTGAAYDREQEAALRPGQSLRVRDYTIRYDRSRMEVDANKRMIFADMTLLKNGKILRKISPAKFIYRTHPQMPTTEVAIRSTWLDDVYVIMNSIQPETKIGTFKVIVRPFVMWIWLGGLLLIAGVLISMSPSVRELLGQSELPPVNQTLKHTAAATLFLLATLVTTNIVLPTPIHAQDSSSLHAGAVSLKNPQERKLFERLLCQCGDCARLPLSTCACGWADEKREQIRAQLTKGESISVIEQSYRDEFGPKAIAVPSDNGLDRAAWAIPVTAALFAVLLLVWSGKRWMRRTQPGSSMAMATSADSTDRYQTSLDDELRRMDERS